MNLTLSDYYVFTRKDAHLYKLRLDNAHGNSLIEMSSVRRLVKNIRYGKAELKELVFHQIKKEFA